MSRRLLMAVVGDANLREDDARYRVARELGRLAVDASFRIVCGGLHGVMEAACRGAHESERYAEGDTLGLLPGYDPANANPWVDIALPTGMDHLRNALVASCDVLVAIGGGAGTLSEIAFAWMYRRPVIALPGGGWAERVAGTALDDRREGAELGVIHVAATAAEAVAIAVRVAPGGGRLAGRGDQWRRRSKS